MNSILYLLWPGCMWAAITKVLSSGPQGPFTQWCNVCTLMALAAAECSPYQGPRPDLPRPSGRLRIHRIVYSITAYRPLTKARKRAKGEEVRRMKNRGIRCLESWLLSIKGPPSPILWRKRGGRRVGLHSSLLMPWRGVDSGCATGNEDRPKPLQTHRPQQANALLVSKSENPETEVDPPKKTDQTALLVRCLRYT